MLWGKLFPGLTQPDLVGYKKGYLETIVNSPIAGSTEKPADCYKQLLTAVLTRMLSGSSNDDNLKHTCLDLLCRIISRHNVVKVPEGESSKYFACL
jgi:hypothetical protein